MTLGFALALFLVIMVVSKMAKKNGFVLFFGVLAFLTFIAILKGGIGFDLLDWGNNPKVPDVELPDNIPLPGD